MSTDADLALVEACTRTAEVAAAIGKLIQAGTDVPESATDHVEDAHDALVEALHAYHHPKPTLVPHLEVVPDHFAHLPLVEECPGCGCPSPGGGCGHCQTEAREGQF